MIFKYFLILDGVTALCQPDESSRSSREVQHRAVPDGGHGPAGVPQEDRRLLARALPPDDYDQEHLPVP